MKLKTALWYLGVALGTAALVLAVLWRSWALSAAVFVLAVILKYTNKHIPLPKLYEKMGVKNDIFEGKVKR